MFPNVVEFGQVQRPGVFKYLLSCGSCGRRLAWDGSAQRLSGGAPQPAVQELVRAPQPAVQELVLALRWSCDDWSRKLSNCSLKSWNATLISSGYRLREICVRAVPNGAVPNGASGSSITWLPAIVAGRCSSSWHGRLLLAVVRAIQVEGENGHAAGHRASVAHCGTQSRRRAADCADVGPAGGILGVSTRGLRNLWRR